MAGLSGVLIHLGDLLRLSSCVRDPPESTTCTGRKDDRTVRTPTRPERNHVVIADGRGLAAVERVLLQFVPIFRTPVNPQPFSIWREKGLAQVTICLSSCQEVCK